MTTERTGWNGQFWLNNGAALVKLEKVTGIGFPDEEVDETEITPIDAAGKRKQYLPTMVDGGEFDVVMNYIPNSATDTLCQGAKGVTRAWKIVVPKPDGTPDREISGSGFVKSYARSDMSTDEALTATITIRVSGAVTEGPPA